MSRTFDFKRISDGFQALCWKYGGTEIDSSKFEKFCKEHGITLSNGVKAMYIKHGLISNKTRGKIYVAPTFESIQLRRALDEHTSLRSLKRKEKSQETAKQTKKEKFAYLNKYMEDNDISIEELASFLETKGYYVKKTFKGLIIEESVKPVKHIFLSYVYRDLRR